MYLKSIEIQGFKSFAHKTVLDFQNGITGIVGPNGSGKSNIADAVRWVFGEQSAKQLRGSSMQDVIFAGTQLRKPQSFASVSITLDNTDRALNIDFDEVTVTRKVYRSGESEYILNNNRCLLREINELFYDTGIGKEGYSIIGQGQVDKILSGKPEERRELFDEAAGIVKFKKRKSVAMHKLESERENMVRLTDIIGELEKQVGPLKRQSETAKKYLELRDSLKSYDINAFLLDNAVFSEQLVETGKNLALAGENLKEKNDEIEELRKQYSFVDEELKDIDGKIDQVRSNVMASGTSKSALEGEINVVHEKIHSEEANITHFENRIHELETDIVNKQNTIADIKKESEDSKSKTAEAEAAFAEKFENLRALETEINLYRDSIEESHGREISLLTERSSVQARVSELNALLSQNEIRKNEYEEREQDLNDRIAALEKEIEEGSKALTESTEAITAKEQETGEFRDQLNEADRNLSENQRKFNDLMQRYQVEKSRVDTLRAMQERYEGYNPAVRKIMEIYKNDSSVCGAVADILKTEPKYQTLIETVLGGNFQNIVVEKESKAKELVEYLRENKEGRATFLPLDSLNPTGGITDKAILNENGVLGTADELVQYEKKYEPVAKYLLERFLAVDTMENALRIARKYHYSVRIATLDGEFLNVGGSITGGAMRNKANVLNRTAELDRMEENAKKCKDEADKISRTMNQLKQIKSSTAVEITDLEEELKELEKNDLSIRASLDSKRREKTALSTELLENRSSKETISEESKGYDTELRAITKALSELDKVGSDSGDANDETKKLLDQAVSAHDLLQNETQELNLALQRLRQSEEFRSDSVSRLEQEIQNAFDDQAALKQNIRNSKTQIEDFHVQIEDLTVQIKEAADNTSGLDETLKLLQEKRDEIAENQRTFFRQQEDLSNTINDLSKEEIRLQGIKERLEEKLDSATEYLWEEYGMTPSEAARFEDGSLHDETPANIRKKAAELKSSIKALGNVNVNAIEQYAEVSERYEFMHGQYEDLVEAEKSLVAVIEDLDNGMRKQFSEKLEEIRVEYDKVFKQLFGGGTCDIRLDSEADIIDADISIISQPPGKKLQNMMQLSGGEKALSAISLIFAIQNLKPSPFCILDEIEAALDDSNVGRFTNYLHRLTDHTQFVVITHRRGTMVASDRLYGITMQEKGVSTLVSVNLVEKELDD